MENGEAFLEDIPQPAAIKEATNFAADIHYILEDSGRNALLSAGQTFTEFSDFFFYYYSEKLSHIFTGRWRK